MNYSIAGMVAAAIALVATVVQAVLWNRSHSSSCETFATTTAQKIGLIANAELV